MFVLQEGHNRKDQFPKGQILFRNFTKLSEKSLLDVLAQRNATRIRIAMNNSNIISLSEHLYFCEQLKADKTKLYTQVLLNDKFIGVMDLQHIDYKEKTYEPGCYFIEGISENVMIACSCAFSRVCLDLDIYYPRIVIKSSNLRSLMFNTMKLGNRVVSENEEFYILTNDFLNPALRSREEIIKNIETVTKGYKVVYEI